MAEDLTDLDVIIIGGGPAGLSAALWCANLGMRALVFEKEAEFGGQLLLTFNAIKNHLGVEAADGRELCARFLQHIDTANVRRMVGASVESVDLVMKTVILTDGSRHSAKSLIIATGVRRRKLEVPGEEEFRGNGILESGERDKEKMSGKRVMIVGGGDAALENAFILSATATKVIVVHRRDAFSARDEFIQAARQRRNIEFVMDSRVAAIVGGEAVVGVEVDDLESGTRSKIDVDAVLIRIGVVPNTEIFRGQVALDDAGYICIDAACRTNIEAVFAAGDAASPAIPTISNAIGHGAAAAKLAAELLVP